MSSEANVNETKSRGAQVSCVVTSEELEIIEDYRFNKQIAERRDVKRSDVVREALDTFFAAQS